MTTRKTYQTAIVLSLVFLICSCLSQTPVIIEPEDLKPTVPKITEDEAGQEIEKWPEAESYLTIIAVGDNLYHSVMISGGEDGDYLSAYTEIKPLAEKADIAFINQETLLAGADFGFSGYPRFNSPQALGDAIEETGFNVINHANNHVMDKGEKAVLATMDFWEAKPHISVLGIHRSEEKRKLPVLVKKNNFTIGFLAYTYGTNGISVPAGKSYLVSLINEEKIAQEIDALRPLCDFLIVSMHWGEEYKHDYNKSQNDLAALLAKHKTDLALGHHPHVIQKVEVITRPDGKEMICYYSLGNFISAQTENPRMLGAAAYLKLKKHRENGVEAQQVSVSEYGAIPLVTHYEKDFTGFKVYPLYDYTEDIAKKHRLENLSLDYLKTISSRIFGDKELLFNPFSLPLGHMEKFSYYR